MKLSPLLSDGMVLQHSQQVKIWGISKENQEVELSFLGQNYNIISDKDGAWQFVLEDLKPGGPHIMELYDGEKTVIRDIYIGDVWLLGGQSNMELPVSRTLDLYEKEVENSKETNIRMFAVPQQYNFHQPQQELSDGKWLSVTPENVMKFSAIGYFFAKELLESYGVPIGLLQAAVGGTPVEAWISEPTLYQFDGYEEVLQPCKEDSFIKETQNFEASRNDLWYQELNEKDLGLKGAWYRDTYDTSNWSELRIPKMWEGTELEHIRGSVWFKKEIDIPENVPIINAKLVLGTIVDGDDTYVNGTLVGNTGYRYPPRRYHIPDGILKTGRNTITVRVISNQNNGGFITDKPYKLILGEHKIELGGNWRYQIGAEMTALEPATFFQYKPVGLYNGMLSPLKQYSIKGAAFYQGESNTGNPEGYKELFAAMIEDWRKLWNLGNFPFLYVQLANYVDGKKSNTSCKWAELREEQRCALTIPNTAMTVTIDIGEYNDLHPQNKKEVGHRLALCAKKLAYNEPIISSGPLYERMVIRNNSIQLYFTQIGTGLEAKNGTLSQFTISGEDETFVPAKAVIEDSTVIVTSDNIMHPKQVRYAWSDNPNGANLYNKESLPASPFSTQTNI